MPLNTINQTLPQYTPTHLVKGCNGLFKSQHGGSKQDGEGRLPFDSLGRLTLQEGWEAALQRQKLFLTRTNSHAAWSGGG